MKKIAAAPPRLCRRRHLRAIGHGAAARAEQGGRDPRDRRSVLGPRAGKGGGRSGTARAGHVERWQDGVCQQLRHRAGAGPHDLDDRHRRHEGTAPHRRRTAQPAARPRVREWQTVFLGRGRQKIGRYDPAADKIDWQFETGQTGTHMVLPSRDARTIFTSNIGSDSVSVIEAGAGGRGRRPWFRSAKVPKASTCRRTANRCGARTRATAACRSSTWRRRKSCRPSTSARSDRTGSS